MGPMLVTADETGHPDTFTLETKVNGEVRQLASVADLIFDIPTLIAVSYTHLTLPTKRIV